MTRDWTQEYFGITDNTPVSDAESVLIRKLEIAVNALEIYAIPFNQLSPVYNIAQHHKRAEEALAKIKEIK